ncbi:hypothetical protein OIU34_33785 [Pararhizobium sp. BT-229]|uniref:hypothetical protein n=1 Tax=Pararhizobium sp. BT-229 TaxID=2986923 RepID=UPI0021F7F4D7|nr:hypothetical protein [Pararhizobium sp. BT-229]MCV9966826.1 hypothetical protein [Pararhizobium sp. BT-229]
MHPIDICKPTEIKWQPVIVLRGGTEKKVCGPLQGFEILNRHMASQQPHLRECSALLPSLAAVG